VPLEGNACAVVFDAQGLDSDRMLAIARELRQSETAFVSIDQNQELHLRLFTIEKEIPLAGHPTIAAVHAALELGVIQKSAGADLSMIRVHLVEGPIFVEIESQGLIRMAQRKPKFLSTHDQSEVAHCFGISPSDLLDNVPCQVVSTGTPQLMVALKSLEALRKVSLNLSAYEAFRKKAEFFSPHLFCLQGATPQGQTFARHPSSDGEDSFTGSATGAMAAYLFRHQLIKSSSFIAEQGHFMGRPGQATVRIDGQPNAIESVSVAGYAVTIMTGEMRV
jgi:trans-2,3-dihydro-3-hydroxyanthranilate isomerase